jgi:hypothetical protein
LICSSTIGEPAASRASFSSTACSAIESARAETFRSKRETIRKNPRFRGVLGVRLCSREPETEGSGLNSSRGPRLSLLPCSAVPFRARFARA